MNSNLTKYQLLVREYSRQKDFIQERLKQRKQVFENIFEELKPIGGEHPESYEKRKKRRFKKLIILLI